jgi:hypothetical protein
MRQRGQLWVACCKILGWRSVVQGLVRPYRVVDPLPVQELGPEVGYGEVRVDDLIELLGVGTMGALDTAVEFRAVRRQDEEPDAPLLAGLLKGSLELRAAIHLDSPDWEGHPTQEVSQEGGGSSSGGPSVDLQHVPTADHVSGGEMLEHYSRQGAHVQGV